MRSSGRLAAGRAGSFNRDRGMTRRVETALKERDLSEPVELRPRAPAGACRPCPLREVGHDGGRGGRRGAPSPKSGPALGRGSAATRVPGGRGRYAVVRRPASHYGLQRQRFVNTGREVQVQTGHHPLFRAVRLAPGEVMSKRRSLPVSSEFLAAYCAVGMRPGFPDSAPTRPESFWTVTTAVVGLSPPD